MAFPGLQWAVKMSTNPTLIPSDVADGRSLWTEANLPPEILDLTSGKAARADGGDLLVYLQEPKKGAEPPTRYAIDIEKWSPVAGVGGTAVVFVRLPNWSGSIPSVAWLAWGDASGSQPVTGAPFGRDASFSAVYEAAYALNEDPAGIVPQAIDRTGGTHDMTSKGGMVSGDLVPGEIGNAWDFEGSKNQAAIAASQLGLTSKVSAGLWADARPTATQEMMLSEWDSVQVADQQWFISRQDTGHYTFGLRQSNGQFKFKIGSTAFNDSARHFVVGVANGSDIFLYVDGLLDVLPASYDGTITSTGNTKTAIAAIHDLAGLIPATATIDAPWVRSDGMTADEITAEFNNQNSPGTFTTAGAIKTIGPADNANNFFMMAAA